MLSVVNAALEDKRRDKTIGSALEAAPVVHIADGSLIEAFDGIDAAEVFRTSQATLSLDAAPADAFRLDGVTMVAVAFAVADGHKCERCWRILPEVKAETKLCLRCEAVVAEWDVAHG